MLLLRSFLQWVKSIGFLGHFMFLLMFLLVSILFYCLFAIIRR
jgi:hypothetical protein